MHRLASGARRLPGFAGLALAGVLIAAAPAPADTTNGNLPGGTAISVGIAAPDDGGLIASPTGDVSLGGTAAVGQGVPVANTTLIYVVDRSGSTQSTNGCGGNQNGDGFTNSVLDCEIAAARALNQQAIAAGTVGQVGAVFFDTGAQVQDVNPVLGGTQGLTNPATDSDGDAIPDVEETLRTATIGGNTNFEAAVQAACGLVQQSTNPNNIVVFLSDGVATTGGNALSHLPCGPKTATFQTFAVGSGSSCTATGGGRGSLAQIAAATGGACTPVTNVASLPAVVPGLHRLEAQQAPADRRRRRGPGHHRLGEPGPAAERPGLGELQHDRAGARARPAPAVRDGERQRRRRQRRGDALPCRRRGDDRAHPAGRDERARRARVTHTVTATVAAGADGGVAGVTVGFSIGSGPNAGASASAITDAAGQATSMYTAAQGLAGLGTDAITGCFTDSQSTTACDGATKRWFDTTAPAVRARRPRTRRGPTCRPPATTRSRARTRTASTS